MTALYIGPDIEIPDAERVLFDSLELTPVPDDPDEIKLEVSDFGALIGLKVVIGDYLGLVRSRDTGELPPVAREVSDKLADEIIHVQDGEHPEDKPFVLELRADEAQVVTAALSALVQKPKPAERTDPYEWLYTRGAPSTPEAMQQNSTVTPPRFKMYSDD